MDLTTTDPISDTATGMIDRRRFLKMATGIGAAALTVNALGRTAGAQDVGASTAGFLRTTSSVRLRTGPSLRRRILLEIPGGAKVTDLGVIKYGFRNVVYQGVTGWASGDYLEMWNGGAGDPVITSAARTTTSVNLRSGPGTGNSILRVLPAGKPVQTSNTIRNGYRYVIADGLAGWVVDGALRPEGDSPAPGTLRTTSDLNLRAEPSTSARVLAVMPEGTTVKPTGRGSGRYAQVVYGRLTGWAHLDYLN